MAGTGPAVLLDQDGLAALVAGLAARGYTTVGPTLRDGAIVYDRIRDIADLPAGWTDRQAPGQYRLERREDRALFGYPVGPDAWKRFLHPPQERLWRATREGAGFSITPEPPPETAYAFLGVRGCDLAAIAIQDRVLAQGTHADTAYAARRRRAFLVAVNCGTAGATCFCPSMGTGPAVRQDDGAPPHDIALTELIDAARHHFLAEPASPAGADLLASLPARPAQAADLAAARAVSAATAAAITRRLDTDGLKQRLQDNPEHQAWQEVAARCLACGNCTMVCPTCFCTTVSDHTDLAGQEAERRRSWDSCFTADFSFIHGGTVRGSAASRYRQWLTHKLAGWIDQFGSSGCVGCGRCIAWCPVGIDLTETAAAIGRPDDGDA